MMLMIEEAALSMSVQDEGRFGYQRYGLPESGPMDWYAHMCANILVGNPRQSTCIEIGFSSAKLSVDGSGLLAVCGTGYRLLLNGRKLPLWMAVKVKAGDELRLEKCTGGNWVYLAVAGGILSDEWMGSRSVYPRAGMGTMLAPGDTLQAKPGRLRPMLSAGRTIKPSFRPPYRPNITLRVVLGPHQERFVPETLDVFLHQAYILSPHSDRMGYRLTGTTLHHQEQGDLISQGMVLGQIQVPPDGQPIVMMPDHPTTGGYACIATAARVDLPLLAQAVPGLSEIKFELINHEAARTLLVETLNQLESAALPEEDAWLHL